MTALHVAMFGACQRRWVTRIPDELAAAIDELVRDGVFASRSDAVRVGLDALVHARLGALGAVRRGEICRALAALADC